MSPMTPGVEAPSRSAPEAARPAAAKPVERFFAALVEALDAGSVVRLVLAKYRGPEADLERVTVRPIVLRGEAQLSFVDSHTSRDVTRNLPRAAGLAALREMAGGAFGHLHLLTIAEDIELRFGKRGTAVLHRTPVQRRPAAGGTVHDRPKARALPLDTLFLAALGVTGDDGRLVPAMARKYKQINKFVEVFDHALHASPSKDAPTVRVADFGCGKGYLTFAVHHHLRQTLGRDAEVRGVELRPALVDAGNDAARRLGLAGLRFEAGDVGAQPVEPLDVLIALHACDTATDHALHHGVRTGASVLLASPCCHKQLRPQMTSPPLLAPLLQHGIHLGQEAEMVTDGLRALLLETRGYATQVFEFVALEHTSKNKMILAVKQAVPPGAAALAALKAQIEAIKAFYGIRTQCLETLLAADEAAA